MPLILRVFAILFFFGSSVTSAGSQTGKIQQLIVRSDNLHYVILAGTPTGRPACTGAMRYFMIKDENSAAGKSQYSALLAASLAGKVITVAGTNACTRWPDGEDISYIEINN